MIVVQVRVHKKYQAFDISVKLIFKANNLIIILLSEIRKTMETQCSIIYEKIAYIRLYPNLALTRSLFFFFHFLQSNKLSA